MRTAHHRCGVHAHLRSGASARGSSSQMETHAPSVRQGRATAHHDRLNAAEAFETFLQTKFVGQKRFSLEGGESRHPDARRDPARCSRMMGCDEVCHRHVSSRPAQRACPTSQVRATARSSRSSRATIVHERSGSGDVKYHLGTEGTYTSHDGESTYVYLAANPSHLEAVNPVSSRASSAPSRTASSRPEEFPVLPILVHGDAAFAGQGVVTETLNLSQLRGYRTGGTIHMIINNQIGFTTRRIPRRSSFYSTDIAKSTSASDLPRQWR